VAIFHKITFTRSSAQLMLMYLMKI